MHETLLDDLGDRAEWIATSLKLQATHDEEALREAFTRLARLQQRLETRPGADAAPFALLARRFALTDTEQQVLMLLITLRTRPDVLAAARQIVMASELTLDAIRTLIYGLQPSGLGIDELCGTGTLRRFGLIERNDDHGPTAHESKQTWAIASRLLTFVR